MQRHHNPLRLEVTFRRGNRWCNQVEMHMIHIWQLVLYWQTCYYTDQLRNDCNLFSPPLGLQMYGEICQWPDANAFRRVKIPTQRTLTGWFLRNIQKDLKEHLVPLGATYEEDGFSRKKQVLISTTKSKIFFESNTVVIHCRVYTVVYTRVWIFHRLNLPSLLCPLSFLSPS